MARFSFHLLFLGAFFLGSALSQCSVSITSQTLVNEWSSGSQWSAILENTGTATITNVLLSASNVVSLWPLNAVSSSQWNFPSYLQISPNGQFSFGYIANSASQVDFDVVQVSCQSSSTLDVVTFSLVSQFEEPASAAISVPAGYKLVGGGAYSNTVGYQLISSYPLNQSTWFAQINPDVADEGPSRLTVFALGLLDSQNLFSTQIFKSSPVGVGQSTASGTVDVPSPYVLTAGGADSSDFLYASYPSSLSSWTAGFITNPALGGGFPSERGVTVYAIGLEGPGLSNSIKESTAVFSVSGSGNSPFNSQVSLSGIFTLTSGGALITNGLIIASAPLSSNTWSVFAVPDTDSQSSPAVTIQSYALGIAIAASAGETFCSRISINQVLTNSWPGSEQWHVYVENNGPGVVTGLELSAGTQAGAISDLWSMSSAGNGLYTLPAWVSSLLPAGELDFGYIATSQVAFTTVSVTCQ